MIYIIYNSVILILLPLCVISRYQEQYEGWSDAHQGEPLTRGKKQATTFQECTNGTFGKNCTQNCSSNCVGEQPCDYVTGKCPNGCKPGWRGKSCNTECINGTFGEGCAKVCSCNCVIREHCDHVTGHCPDCKPGWTGESCKKACSNGTYGKECNNTCSNCVAGEPCDHVTGKCPNGCKPGWAGELCDTEVTHGSPCTEGICPDGLKCGLKSHKCECTDPEQHYFDGSICQQRIDFEASCTVQGSCVTGLTCGSVTRLCECSKQTAFDDITKTCKHKCPDNKFGTNCSQECHCSGSPDNCNTTDGSCSHGCADGWAGPSCLEQPPSPIQKQEDGLSPETWGLIVAAIIAGLVIIGGLWYYFAKKQKSKEEPAPKDESESDSDKGTPAKSPIDGRKDPGLELHTVRDAILELGEDDDFKDADSDVDDDSDVDG